MFEKTKKFFGGKKGDDEPSESPPKQPPAEDGSPESLIPEGEGAARFEEEIDPDDVDDSDLSGATSGPVVVDQEGLQQPRPGEPDGLRGRIVDSMRTVFDPEIPVNIYELGLIYNFTIDPAGVVDIKMTLTAPNCPAAGTLPGEVESKVKSVDGVKDATLELVWEPTWGVETVDVAITEAI